MKYAESKMFLGKKRNEKCIMHGERAKTMLSQTQNQRTSPLEGRLKGKDFAKKVRMRIRLGGEERKG